jgi:hypothetical protein
MLIGRDYRWKMPRLELLRNKELEKTCSDFVREDRAKRVHVAQDITTRSDIEFPTRHWARAATSSASQSGNRYPRF